MNHETEFGLKQAKESKGNGSGIVTSEPLDMEAPQFEGHASRDSALLVPGYVHADRGKSKGNGRVSHSEQSQPTVRPERAKATWIPPTSSASAGGISP